MFLTSNGCGQKHKLDFYNFNVKPEDTWRFNTNPSQTIDSIFVFDTGKIINSTGERIYEITTYAEKRKDDSLLEISKNEKFPSPFAPPTTSMPYTFKETTLFIETVYDSLGFEYTKLLEKELLPGEYIVKYAIYSVLKPGSYFMETIINNQKQLRKLIIK
ncbi:MAG TPA: hypothetical protein PKE39_01825 [Ignavibacteria bacterium]|nr:hypothetical protein [Ignavibacteria bacterium]HMQ97738.1 hypothetical protein [Ignavibacteria bacterium]